MRKQLDIVLIKSGVLSEELVLIIGLNTKDIDVLNAIVDKGKLKGDDLKKIQDKINNIKGG